eukprot:290690_1
MSQVGQLVLKHNMLYECVDDGLYICGLNRDKNGKQLFTANGSLICDQKFNLVFATRHHWYHHARKEVPVDHHGQNFVPSVGVICGACILSRYIKAYVTGYSWRRHTKRCRYAVPTRLPGQTFLPKFVIPYSLKKKKAAIDLQNFKGKTKVVQFGAKKK